MNAYEVGIKGTEYTATIYAATAGKAKYQRLLDARDCWPDLQFKHLTCRSLGNRPIPPTPAEIAQSEADAFNALFSIGTRLCYWSGLKEGAPTGTAPIYHEATVVCGSAVIWLQGVSSCHALTHVEPEVVELGSGNELVSHTQDSNGVCRRE